MVYVSHKPESKHLKLNIPAFATESIGKSNDLEINPKPPKMVKPAKILVPSPSKHIVTVSLKQLFLNLFRLDNVIADPQHGPREKITCKAASMS